MSKGKKIAIAVLIAVIAGIVAFSVYVKHKPKVVVVQTEKAVTKDLTQVVNGTGKVKPVMEVSISADVSGAIMQLGVVDGGKVKKGQFLVKLDQSRYLATVDQAGAAVRSAKAAQKLAEANLEQAEKKFVREKEILARKLDSQEQYELIETQYKVAKANVESAQEAVAQAEAALRQANDDLSKTVLSSPVSGTVSSLDKEVGEIVMGSTFTKDVIMTVADLSKMEILVDVDENDVPDVKVGDNAVIEIDAFQKQKFNGKVLDIARAPKSTKSLTSTQEESINYEVKVSVDGDVTGLRPGMTASVDIQVKTSKAVLAVPIQCVTMRNPELKGKVEAKTDKAKEEKLKEVAFRVKNGAAQMVPVTTGISSEYEIEIVGGSIAEGDELVSGPFKVLNKELKDGDLIRVDNELKDDKDKK